MACGGLPAGGRVDDKRAQESKGEYHNLKIILSAGEFFTKLYNPHHRDQPTMFFAFSSFDDALCDLINYHLRCLATRDLQKTLKPVIYHGAGSERGYWGSFKWVSGGLKTKMN